MENHPRLHVLCVRRDELSEITRVRVLVWGTSWNFYASFSPLLLMRELGQVELVAITGATIPNVATIDGIPVMPREDAVLLDYDLVMVMSVQNYKGILADVVSNWNVPRHKVVSCELLRVAHLDLRSWIKLRDSRVSIISNGCWGGFMYNLLQLECLSPFRNLFVVQPDYLRLLGNLRHYVVDCEPEFSEYRYDFRDTYYPVLKLDDMPIHFNHATTPEEAIVEWNKRKGRINWDNLFVMLFTLSPELAQEFEGLTQFDKRICLVPFETDLPHCMRIPLIENDTWFFDAVNGTARKDGRNFCFDPVKLLLGEPEFSRITF